MHAKQLKQGNVMVNGVNSNSGTHCAFSANLFHGHLAQIYIKQLSDLENKKCSP